MCQQVFRARTPPEAIELVARLLEYTPSSRISPLQACAHQFFNELREPNTRLPNGNELPPLFNFTEQGNWRCIHILIIIWKICAISLIFDNQKSTSCVLNESFLKFTIKFYFTTTWLSYWLLNVIYFFSK